MLKQYIEAIEQNNIVSKTDINGIITFANEEFCKISKYRKEELIGKNHNIVRDPTVSKTKFKLLWDTIRSKQTYKATVRNRAKDGSTYYINATIVPTYDDKQKINGYIAIRQDITKEKIAKNKINIGTHVKVNFVKDRPGHDLRYALDSNKIKKKLILTTTIFKSIKNS